MIKHLEIKSYEVGDVEVSVKINFDKNEVSLVQKEGQGFTDKRWLFSSRSPEYKNGWLNILYAMEYAIEQAFDELKEYTEMKQKEKISNTEAILDEAVKIVKGRSYKPKMK